jgi:malate permease and related proteins
MLMTELLGIILNVISPVFIVAGLGALVGRVFKPDPRTLSVYLIYLFSPALVYDGLASSELPTDQLLRVGAVVIGVALVMALISYGLARLQNLSQRMTGAFVLSIILVNAANYGIPLNTFAFGAVGEQTAITYYAISSIVGSVLGVYFASMGSVPTLQAVGNIFRVPITYAALLGFVVNLADISVPLAVDRAVSVAAEASVPLMLALLGLQLANISIEGNIRPMLVAVGAKLLIAPLVAVPLALLLGLQGVPYAVSVIESSMPTAVMSIALATQFGSDAAFTAAVTLISTLASILTLSVLILILQNTI